MSRSGVESALNLLSSETRLDILRVLATHRFDDGDSGMTFTELFEAVGADDSGNFNYHLKRLLEHLVTKDGDCYRLTHGGVQLFSALQATTYAPRHEASIPLDQPCPLCADELTATYHEGHLDIGCGTHLLLETYVHHTWVESLPTDELLRRVSLLFHHQIENIVTGFCPLCHGAVERNLRTGGESFAIQYYYPCTQCGTELRLRPQQTVLHHERVAAFYREQGIDPRNTPPWHLYDTYGDARVASEDPPHVEFELHVGDDSAVVVVDGLGNLVSFARSSE